MYFYRRFCIRYATMLNRNKVPSHVMHQLLATANSATTIHAVASASVAASDLAKILNTFISALHWTIVTFSQKLTGLIKTVALLFIVNLLIQQPTITFAANGRVVTSTTINNQTEHCAVLIDDAAQYKTVGSKWILPEDPCVIHACELQNSTEPVEVITNEHCNEFLCDIGSEVRPKPGTCCGECVRTKCLHQNNIYRIGQTWYDEENCALLECAAHNLNEGEAIINVYRNYCPSLPQNCPSKLIYRNTCCQYCYQTRNNKRINHFDYVTINNDVWTTEFYRHHECARKCRENELPKTCRYRFVVEWYETLSKACYECPYNITDCERPHCVTGDGVRRSITVVNRMMPGPEIQVCQNDIVQVDVENGLLGDSTTIHWHGMHMKDTPYMDGVPHITQCPISPHATFRYTFKAENPGTHFWHSHTGMQRGDGVFGAFVVKQPKTQDPHGLLYDFDLAEHKMLLQDWVHVTGVSMFASHHHSRGDNKPINLLINGKGRYYPGIWEEIRKNQQNKFSQNTDKLLNKSMTHDENVSSRLYIKSDKSKMPAQDNEVLRTISSASQKLENKTKVIIKRGLNDDSVQLASMPLEVFQVTAGYRYRFRIINAEFLNCPIQVSVDNHTLIAINSDGYDFEAADVGSIVIYAGERFDFVLNANQIVGNYWIRLKGLMDCDERFTSAFQVAILRYSEAPEEEPPLSLAYNHQAEGITLNALNQGSGHVDSLTIAEVNSLTTANSLPGVQRAALKPIPDYKFFVYYDFYRKDNPIFHPNKYYGINANLHPANRVFTPQLNHISLKVPSMALLPARHRIHDSMFCNETSLARQGIDCRQEFCQCCHVLQVPLNSVVEIVLVDEGFTYEANHPFHLHGNAFRVVGLERLGENVTIEMIKELDRNNVLKRNLDQPPVKDTVTVPDGGYTIIRFQASNPGFWLFHCHIEFHAEVGMALVLKVGDNEEMPETPKNFPTCHDYYPLENDGIEESSAANTWNRIASNLKILLYLKSFILLLNNFLIFVKLTNL